MGFYSSIFFFQASGLGCSSLDEKMKETRQSDFLATFLCLLRLCALSLWFLMVKVYQSEHNKANHHAERPRVVWVCRDNESLVLRVAEWANRDLKKGIMARKEEKREKRLGGGLG